MLWGLLGLKMSAKQIEDEQLRELLGSLTVLELQNVCNRLDLEISGTKKENAISALLTSDIPIPKIIKKIKKADLVKFIQHKNYFPTKAMGVDEIRIKLCSTWEVEKSKKLEIKQNPVGDVQHLQLQVVNQAISLTTDHNVQLIPTIPIHQNQHLVQHQQHHNHLTYHPPGAGQEFANVFYSLLNGPIPNGVVQQGFFSEKAILENTIFAEDGTFNTVEVTGLPNIEQYILPLAKQCLFHPGSCIQKTNEFGILVVEVKGNVVHPASGIFIGLFAHFFEFYKLAEKYKISNCKMHLQIKNNSVHSIR